MLYESLFGGGLGCDFFGAGESTERIESSPFNIYLSLFLDPNIKREVSVITFARWREAVCAASVAVSFVTVLNEIKIESTALELISEASNFRSRCQIDAWEGKQKR